MKAVIHFHTDLAHQRKYAELMRAGLERQGVTVAYGHYNAPTVRELDFAVVWGSPAKQPAVAAASPRLLVMERGHVGDRMTLVSCGWDAIGRRGRYARPADGGARWNRLFGHLLEPYWFPPAGTAPQSSGYALLIGQVPGDAALGKLELDGWVKRVTTALANQGWAVRYRPHPLAIPPRRSLAEDLAGAGVCVTFNSTAGVEAVLAGVPTVTLDEGAMAWDVAGHALDEIVRPDRTAWAHDLAYTTWTPDELSSGEVWAHLAPIMEEAACPSA